MKSENSLQVRTSLSVWQAYLIYRTCISFPAFFINLRAFGKFLYVALSARLIAVAYTISPFFGISTLSGSFQILLQSGRSRHILQYPRYSAPTPGPMVPITRESNCDEP